VAKRDWRNDRYTWTEVILAGIILGLILAAGIGLSR
jgi:hypothetical protein